MLGLVYSYDCLVIKLCLISRARISACTVEPYDTFVHRDSFLFVRNGKSCDTNIHFV